LYLPILELAKRTMEAAKESGANSVKFQNYRTEDFLSGRELTYTYGSLGCEVTESQWEMFKRCELTDGQLRSLKRHADEIGIHFHSTPSGTESLADLLGLPVDVLKNSSDFLGNIPFIEEMAHTGLPLVISTGMSTLAEIDCAVQAFRANGNEKLIILHCTSCYPTPPEDTHLRKIPALAAAFGALVGFSDHTQGITASTAAVVLGACWIERHFTLDRSLPGPDHWFSSDPRELKQLVKAVRTVEGQLGKSALGHTPGERNARENYRISCVAARDLECGHIVTAADIRFARPGTGLTPALSFLLHGRPLRGPLKKGDPITLSIV
jgi:N,N'-diacetyllegionaminate synthase